MGLNKVNTKDMTPSEIVQENFKGLDELIEDKDLLEFYKDLIATCMEEYHEQKMTEFYTLKNPNL